MLVLKAHPFVIWGFLILFVTLFGATLYTYYLRFRHPDRDYTELGLRMSTWWKVVGLFAVALLFTETLAIVFFALISFLALKEYFSLVPTRRADRSVLLWVYLCIPLQYFWVYDAWYGMFIIFIPVYAFLFLPLRMIIVGETREFLRSVGSIHWGLMLFVYSISHVAYLLALPEFLAANPDKPVNAAGGAGMVLFVVFLTQFNDVAQYVSGKTFGRRKITSVSPNKTWEGLIGGVATTTLLSLLSAPFLTPLTFVESIAMGLIIGIAGFVGDVTISALKRDLHVKDSGTLLPGHGGILDRIDSLTFTAPLFFHFTYYFHY